MKSLSTKVLVIILPIILVFVLFESVILGFRSKSLLDNYIGASVVSVQQKYAHMIEEYVSKNIRVADTFRIMVENTYQNNTINSYEDMVLEVLTSNKSVFGFGVFFESEIAEEYKKTDYIYAFEENGTTQVTTEDTDEVNYQLDDYYMAVKETGQYYITEAYYDEVVQTYLMSISVPMFDDQGEFIGCVIVDNELTELENIIKEYNSENGWFYVLNDSGVYLGNENIETVKEQVNALESKNSSFVSAMKKVYKNDSGTTQYEESGKEYRIYYSTLSELNWKIIFIIPMTVVFGPITNVVLILSVMAILSVLMVSGMVIGVMKLNVVKPIRVLLGEFDKISNNDFHVDIPKSMIDGKDEISILVSAFIQMKDKLREYQGALELAFEKAEEYVEELSAQRDDLIESQEELSAQRDELINSKAELTRAHKFTDGILNAIPDLVVVVTKDNICKYCIGAEENIGQNSNAVIGKHMSAFVDDELVVAEATQKIHNVLDSGATEHMECEFSMEAGETKYLDLIIAGCFEDSVIIIGRDISNVHMQMNDIEYLSYHDQMTGLHNRRYYDTKMKQYVEEKAYPLSVIMADLNGLKLINDSFGHEMGDLLLNSFTRAILDTQIDKGLVARIGGDEFVIVLPNTKAEDAKILVEKIKDNCSKKQINGVPVSASYGVSTMRSDADSFDEVVKNADDIMYQNKLNEAPDRRQKTIDLIMSTLQEKNSNIKPHVECVERLCREMAKELDLLEEEQNKLRTAGLLHEIGMIGVPNRIIDKKGELTEEEKIEVRKHPDIGYRILKAAGNMNDIAEIVLAHHENWDGSGYPKGLTGTDIPLEARIISIADAYTAMLHDMKNTGKQMDKTTILKELKESAGTQFDEELVNAFVSMLLEYQDNEL